MTTGRPKLYNFSRDVMDRWAREMPESLALWCVDGHSGQERRITFRQVQDEFHRAATFLLEAGIRRGDRVLIMLPRMPQWWVAMLGLMRMGAVAIPATTLLTEKDVRYRLEAAEISAVITDEEGAGKMGAFAGVRIIVGSDRAGWVSFDKGVAQADGSTEFEPTGADEPCLTYFTSGTSGPPKMAVHTHASYGLAHRVTGEHWLDLRRGEVHWLVADPGWGKAAWSALFGPWHMGACVFVDLTYGKFHPRATLQTLSKYPINTFCAPPTALRLIVCEDLSGYRFPHLRHCVTAGEMLAPEVLRRWKEATGLIAYEGYGQTETVILVANFRRMGREVKPGSMGFGAPGYEIELLDEQLNVLPADREGQIAIRVKPQRPLGLFKEYWRNPEENAARLKGEWYLTGDLARRDAEGYFWFLGRADDVINSSSYRIGPFEVESALAEHPAVLEAAVVGIPDQMRGEIVKAFVVLKPMHDRGEGLKRELQEHCKRITAPYKYPRQIEFIDEMPKTISGKIRRNVLRARSARVAT